MDETNRKIAELLGYRFMFLYARDYLHGEHYEWFAAFKPDGTPFDRITAYGTKNEWPDYELAATYPDYTHDLNAVVAALPKDMTLCIQSYGEKYICALLPLNGEGQGATRQEAAARALLAHLAATAASESP